MSHEVSQKEQKDESEKARRREIDAIAYQIMIRRDVGGGDAFILAEEFVDERDRRRRETP